MLTQCPSCGSQNLRGYYSVNQVPVHSVQLLTSREAALNYPRGEIRLGFCQTCGFIFNMTFDPTLHDYSSRYESTQGFSPTFNSFANRLADSLIARYALHGKDVIEIGCGQGEFLQLLCEKGGNKGTGFDPAYRFEPALAYASTSDQDSEIQFIKDFYSEKYTQIQADFYCCKMTLEHIQDVGEFVSTVRRAIGARKDSVVFFQIPEVTRILDELAFWDIYYEHCSYFSMGSLGRLFRRSGFDVIDLWTGYDDQYLMIEARPGDGSSTPALPQENDLETLAEKVNAFTRKIASELDAWRETVKGYKAQGKKVMLWGSGSKGVAFLTTLGLSDEIEYTVDINPNKHGTFMAGTGQEIVSPEFCRDYKPDVVILMNPIYAEEVRGALLSLGLTPEMHSLGR